MYADTLNAKDTGRKLGISDNTVSVHMYRSFAKLGIQGNGAGRELRLRRKEFGL